MCIDLSSIAECAERERHSFLVELAENIASIFSDTEICNLVFLLYILIHSEALFPVVFPLV